VVLIGRPSGEELLATRIEESLYMVAGSLSIGAFFVYARKFIIPLQIPAAALTTYQLGFGPLLLALCTEAQGMSAILSDLHATAGLP